ncbi:MAG: hypothetical protein ACOYLB_05985 [Phototrophicaceae bacterium]
MRIRQRNLAWVIILSTLSAIAVGSGAVVEPLAWVLPALVAVGSVAVLFDWQPTLRRLRRPLKVNPLKSNMTKDAREAVERAQKRGSYFPTGLQVADVGLIATRNSTDGKTLLEKTRHVSQDDEHIRPYITLHVAPQQSEQQRVIRFELEDAQGETILVHEQKVYLRDGAFNVIADHHVVLARSNLAIAHGNGDLRVYVDHKLIAVLGFTLTPSLKDRWGEGRSQRLHDHATDSDSPTTLEELLRGKGNQ